MSIYIRSIRNIRNTMLNLLEINKIDLVIITEHWLNEDEMKSFVLEGFKKLAEFTRKES